MSANVGCTLGAGDGVINIAKYGQFWIREYIDGKPTYSRGILGESQFLRKWSVMTRSFEVHN